ncbi:MAG: WG repeat-containing protein, partial [Flavobacterium sp.]
DSENNVLIQAKYDNIEYKRLIENPKKESFLIVKEGNLYGMIDLSEKEIIPIKYQNIEIITADFAVLTINNLKHFYNFRTKKLNTNFGFEKFDMYSRQFTRIKKGDKETLVLNDDFSNLLFPFMYEDVSQNDNLFVVKLNSKYGLVDKNNKVIIPILYEQLYISCNKVIAQINNKYGILSLGNKIVMPFEYPNIVGYSEKTEVTQKDFKTKTYDCDLLCIEDCN